MHRYVIIYNMITRQIAPQIKQSLANFPAVLLIGARQSGKSTVAESLVDEGLLQHYFTLDDVSILEAVKTDPDDFLSTITVPVALDEIQRAPDLMRALKLTIDGNRRAGRFLLTGSANILSYPQVAESLAGRMNVIHLEGFSASELAGREQASSFLHDILAGNDLTTLLSQWREKDHQNPVMNKEMAEKLIFYGGYPDVALKADPYFSQRWFGSYLTAYIEKDVRDLARLSDVVSYGKLMRFSGLRTGTQINVSNLAVGCGLDQRTVMRYLELLEITFQINQLQPWHRNTRKRLVKTPKLYINDSGLACFLAGLDTPAQLQKSPFAGALVETWVWSEFRKQLVFEPAVQASYYRTHQGHEVDFVFEKGDHCCGVEVKWAQSVSLSDFKGLKDMQEALGKNTLGILLYMGQELIPFSASLVAVPMRYMLY